MPFAEPFVIPGTSKIPTINHLRGQTASNTSFNLILCRFWSTGPGLSGVSVYRSGTL